MPIRKFRSVEEMSPPPEHRPLDPDNFGRALALSALACGLRPRRFTPGVHKHRSVEELDAARERRR